MAEEIRGSYKDIADAIRAKKGSENEMTPAEMPAEIASITTGITPTGTLNITTNGQRDVTNYANVDVNVPSTADINGTIFMPVSGTGEFSCGIGGNYDTEDGRVNIGFHPTIDSSTNMLKLAYWDLEYEQYGETGMVDVGLTRLLPDFKVSYSFDGSSWQNNTPSSGRCDAFIPAQENLIDSSSFYSASTSGSENEDAANYYAMSVILYVPNDYDDPSYFETAWNSLCHVADSYNSDSVTFRRDLHVYDTPCDGNEANHIGTIEVSQTILKSTIQAKFSGEGGDGS